MTNFEYIRNLLEHKHMNEHDFAELLVVKIDDYNYTSNILFENYITRQAAVEATIEKLEDTDIKISLNCMIKYSNKHIPITIMIK